MNDDLGAQRNADYDRQTVAVMERSLGRNSNCVDVGAYIGTFLAEMLRIAPQGIHFAFEPVPESFQKLAASFGSFPNVRLHRVALSDAAGTSVFHLLEGCPQYSGLKKRWYGPGEHTVREIRVRTAPLDEVVPPDLVIDFIKIDVEGAELQVLRGALGIIRRSRPVIVFEHGLGAADKYGTTPEAVHDLLAGECALRFSLMGDWLQHKPPLTRQSFADAFYTGGQFYFMAHP